MELTFLNGNERLDLNISFRKKIVPLTPYWHTLPTHGIYWCIGRLWSLWPPIPNLWCSWIACDTCLSKFTKELKELIKTRKSSLIPYPHLPLNLKYPQAAISTFLNFQHPQLSHGDNFCLTGFLRRLKAPLPISSRVSLLWQIPNLLPRLNSSNKFSVPSLSSWEHLWQVQLCLSLWIMIEVCLSHLENSSTMAGGLFLLTTVSCTLTYTSRAQQFL